MTYDILRIEDEAAEQIMKIKNDPVQRAVDDAFEAITKRRELSDASAREGNGIAAAIEALA